MDSTNNFSRNSAISDFSFLSPVGRQEAYNGDDIADATCVTIGVASPDTIRGWSHGEVKNAETINYRTLKPEVGGLFCEQIFGPTRDWECGCGKYKHQNKQRTVLTCDKCKVDITLSKVRRERLGRLELAVPVAHIWFTKCMPTRIGTMLDIQVRTLEKVIYYEGWIIINKGDTPLQQNQVLTDEEYQEARRQYGDSFEAGMGAEAIEKLLANLDLPKLREELYEQLHSSRKSKALRLKVTRRIRMVEGFLKNNMNPSWMVLRVLPVLPPDLRPLVALEGGRFASSDLNDLYRRVINRNSRLKNLLQLPTPEVIIRNEKRMLQEAVDALLDNGRHGRAVTGTGNRALKSLADMLKGKQGRFRQNLLGKRVDYSGRSVIVVGPELRINQCGLPKEMALTLFEPFIIQKLKARGCVNNVKNGKKWIEQRKKEVWDILEEVIQGHPVMLNRAPTLHRLSIQAFDPVLIEGQAIRLHPLVCTAFNADFDGDQMAVHVPLSNEAQLEAKLLMLSPNNIFSPASGKPIATPSQDICLGIYFLTYEDRRKHEEFNAKKREEQRWFNDMPEVLRALASHQIGYHDFFNIRNPFYGKETVWGKADKENRFIVTTAGRCIFNEIWPAEMGFRNEATTKKQLGKLIAECYDHFSREKVIEILDAIKAMGYEYATWAGFSIGIQDMIVPEIKKKILADAQAEVDKIREERAVGSLTEQERYNKCVEVWRQANKALTENVISVLRDNLSRPEINPVYAMLDSGARGSEDQIRQLAGMRGLMSTPSGKIIDTPVKANFREGLTVLEYFLSSHGARKGMADTALKTADSGYMTRRLVDVAHDVICVEDDCGTVNGIWIKAEKDKETGELKPCDRIVGRFSVDEIRDPNTNECIVGFNEEITLAVAKKLAQAGIDRVHIRSVLTCESVHGVCARCYGRNLATGDMPHHGDPVGIIAAQSIGEPGTQLTMRTFHAGGTASGSTSESYYDAKHAGRLRLEVTPIRNAAGDYIIISATGRVVIEDENEAELESYELKQGAILKKTTGDYVEEGERIMTWDPFNVPIVTGVAGRVQYEGLIDGTTFTRQRAANSGQEELIVSEIHREDTHPSIRVVSPDADLSGEEDAAPKKGRKGGKGRKLSAAEGIGNYALPAGAHIIVENGAEVKVGDILAKTPRQTKMTNDITGGLPRVAELFEARRPKRAAEIARIDGVATVDHSKTKGGSVILIQDMDSGAQLEHKIPAGKQIIINTGDFVHKGDRLTDGDAVLHDILEVCGPQEMQEHLVNQVQEVYKTQGVDINDKHIEIIVRQMMRRVHITEPGDTMFLYGELIDKHTFEMENARVINEGGVQAEATSLLQGITKAALATDSFISAASFQNTTLILTEAATLGRVDSLHGFKENVIMGHLIPAGTGYRDAQNIKLKYVMDNGEVTEEMPTTNAKKFDDAAADATAPTL